MIDASQLIVVAGQMQPPQQWPVAIDSGNPIGIVMNLRVVRVLDGENSGGEVINVFQPAGGTSGFQPITDAKFILFLRKMNVEERAMLMKVPPAEYPGVVKRFSMLKPEDVVWTLSSPRDQWMGYYPLEEGTHSVEVSILKRKLSTVGVGKSLDPVDYLISIIKQRRSQKATR